MRGTSEDHDYNLGKLILESKIKYAKELAEERGISHAEAIVLIGGIGDHKIKKRKPSYIYLMIDHDNGYHKIGRSTNPRVREKTLQAEKPSIELVIKHKAPKTVETELHNMFKAKRVRGEWFNLDSADLNFIKKYFELTK